MKVVVVASLKWCTIREITVYSWSAGGRALRKGRGLWGGVSYAFVLGRGEVRVVVASLKWCSISERTGYSGATQGEGLEEGGLW